MTKGDFEQKLWALDIGSYQRCLRLLEIAKSDRLKAFCDKRLTEIRAQYPNVKNWPEGDKT